MGDNKGSTSAGNGKSQVGGARQINPMHMLLPLALAQFINAYDTTAMNVAISKVVANLHTTVSGVQSGLVIYSLVMASFMITCSKLGEIWGLKRTFGLGVSLYGIGALITALSINLGMMVFGWSLLEGIGSAFMIPAIFALVAVLLPEGKPRLKGYALIGSAAAAGAALGPLLMGFWATLGPWTWRLSFCSEVLVVLIVLSTMRRIGKVPRSANPPKLDVIGAVLSASGLSLFVLGLLQAGPYGWVNSRVDVEVGGKVLIQKGGISPVIPLAAAGLVVLALFVLWQRHRTLRQKEPLVELSMFKKRAVALGLPAILALMFMEAGLLFIGPLFLQMSLGLNPLLSGLTLMPLTIFLILFSMLSSKLTSRFSPKALVMFGMLLLPIGIILISLMLTYRPSAWQMVPGLIIVGIGIGFANAPLLNMVQSAVPAKEQSDISGVNRAFSNLGGSMGTAIAGAVMISVLISSFAGLVSANKFIPQSEKAHLLQVLPQDASTVSNKQARQYLSKKAFQPDVKNALYDVNQAARNKGMLAGLAAIGILGFMGLLFSLFLPRGAVATKEEGEGKGDDPAREAEPAEQGA